jgi:hypothetical protein
MMRGSATVSAVRADRRSSAAIFFGAAYLVIADADGGGGFLSSHNGTPARQCYMSRKLNPNLHFQIYWKRFSCSEKYSRATDVYGSGPMPLRRAAFEVIQRNPKWKALGAVYESSFAGCHP